MRLGLDISDLLKLYSHFYTVLPFLTLFRVLFEIHVQNKSVLPMLFFYVYQSKNTINKSMIRKTGQWDYTTTYGSSTDVILSLID